MSVIMNDSKIARKEKNQYIQVFVRVRPTNEIDKKGIYPTVVHVPSNKEVLVQERAQDKASKKFIFDRVFDTSSKQVDVYNVVISPLLAEVLAGYNCTVFAYGQTGTGKTYTMEGISNDASLHWQSDTNAGMIPRFLSHLFDELRLLEAQEYTVRISFLELYNEEIFDLLSANDDAAKIRLFEDASKKGSIIIHGLEEVTVHNKADVYKILEKGSEKRQTAATLMNAQSSRSHTVFSVTVHIKENTVDGEELLKTGKLNLVDLAGSENVGRSGAVDRRAREAGSINQSLLTLGRVITALVERAPHIPYRESKLTRLLQESLGGRTKTSIIATISPVSNNLEETLSTLDYAYRAKNITNRPEINQKLSKKALLKEYTAEIERLRRDLLATRNKNGVYLAHENYNEMQVLLSVQSKEIEKKINYIKALEEMMQNKEKIFYELQSEHTVQTKELSQAKEQLSNITSTLKLTSHKLKKTEHDRDEQRHLVEKHVFTEKILLSQAEALLTVADTAITDTHKLHEKIDRKVQVEQKHEAFGKKFRSNISESINKTERDLSDYTQELNQFCVSMENEIDTQTVSGQDSINKAIKQITVDLVNKHATTTDNLKKNINMSYSVYQHWIQDSLARMEDGLTEIQHENLMKSSMTLVTKVDNLIRNEIANTLRLLNNNVSKKLQLISTYAKEAINSICNTRLEDCDRLRKNMNEIKNLLQNHNEIMQKRRLFAQTMQDAFLQFNLLNTSEEENYSTVTNKFDHVYGVCDRISTEITNSCDANIELKKNLEQKVQNDLEEIKSIVTNATSKNEKMANATLQEGNIVLNDIMSSMNKSSVELKQYKNSVEFNAIKMQQKMEEDKNGIIFSVDNIHSVLVDTSASCAEYMEGQKIKISSISKEISRKLENQSAESIAWSNRIAGRLHTTKEDINKFFVEDMLHDIPTGQTPARKEFSYPRQFIVTSPHERILHRFREFRKYSEISEDDVSNFMDDDTLTNEDITVQNITHSTMLAENVFESPSGDSTCTTPTENSNSISKYSNLCNSASQVENVPTHDLKTSEKTRGRSELDVYRKIDNKENGVGEPLKRTSLRGMQQSSSKRAKQRAVLGMRN